MLWIKMGWRNLWRNRRRSLIELTSIAGSIFLAVFMNNLAVGSYAQMINDGVRMGSGHIGVYRTQYLELRKTELTMDTSTIVPALEHETGVAAVYPRLYVPGLVRSSRDSRSSVVLGIDIDREKSSNPIIDPKNISAGELPKVDDPRGALMGQVLAEELDLDVGKKFVVMTQGADGKIISHLFKITGLIHTNARMIDARMVVVPRQVLGEVIGKNDCAHEIAVMLQNHKMINQMLPRIHAVVQRVPDTAVYHWEEAMPEMADAIKMDHIGLLIIVGFMYLIVGIGTINTLLMSVMERTREFGVIRAIGLGRNHIRKIVFSEAFVLSITGVAAGIMLSIIAGLYTYHKGIDYSFMIKDKGFAGTLIEPVMYSGWDWTTTAIIAAGMILIAVTASLYPAHYILKIRPSDAMRKY
ncbi:MAG TPA: FtsX-like permease family protein [Anaerolineae bacterium]|nr:FtsX-like permease family protein [Anaerolineae bacterium]